MEKFGVRNNRNNTALTRYRIWAHAFAANLTTTVSEMTLYVGMRQRDLIFSVLIFSSDV